MSREGKHSCTDRVGLQTLTKQKEQLFQGQTHNHFFVFFKHDMLKNAALNNQPCIWSTINHTFCLRRQNDATRF